MREVYLDNAAATRTDPDVAQTALALMTEDYGNPASLHEKGRCAAKRLGAAREQVAALMGCDPEEISFTSGGTESNNLALLGGAEALRRRGDHIVLAAYEHASVLETGKRMEELGFSVTRIPPNPDGLIDPDVFLDAVTGKTILAGCMLVNSETGALAPIAELFAAIRAKNELTLLHCDAVQAFGKLPFTARGLGADLISVSGHKLHAPKGVGALYIRKGAKITPLYRGGGQEQGIKPGTASTALACAFGRAAEKAGKSRGGDLRLVTELYEYFVNKCGDIPEICINSPSKATPYIVNISLPGYLSSHLINYLSDRGVYVSGGSACSGGKASHVLKSMGLAKDRVDSALRISFSRYSTRDEADEFFAALSDAIDYFSHNVCK